MQRIVCTYKQYYFCGTQKKCPLYNRCSQMQIIPNNTILGNIWLTNQIVYRKYYATPLTIEQRKEHKLLYDFYNRLWGNRKDYLYEYNAKYYNEIIRPQIHNQNKFKIFYYEVEPNIFCNGDCFNCLFEDCVLPNNYKKIEYNRKWRLENPEYHANYREEHREELNRKSKLYYEKNKAEILEKQRQRRAQPEMKKSRAEYDKIYRENNRDKRRAIQKRYYEKHKEEINAKKREKRKKEKFSIESRGDII